MDSFPITAVEALSIHLMLTWFKPLLESWAQTYQPNMFVGTTNLETAKGKLRSTFAEYGLEPQQALTFQMSQLVLYQKSIISS